MIKLIGIDCDDTLLDSNKRISHENCNTIDKVNELGIKCVLTTGRPYVKRTVDYYKDLNLYNEGQYFIAYNGAAIYDIFSGKIIYSHPLEYIDILKIHSAVSIYNVSHYIHKTGTVCYDVMNEYVYLEKKFNDLELIKIDFNNLDTDEKAFKYMLGGSPSLIKEIYEKVPKEVKEKYNVVISMPCFLEFMHKDVNKWNGLKTLANHLSINENSIMAIGDSMNDYEMIKYSKVGVAMGNSVDRIKEIADYVTDTNDNDGVAKIINKLILNK